MSTGQLHLRARAYDREQAWAPAYVANELAGTRQAAQRHRNDATLRAAEATAAANDTDQTRLHGEAEQAAALAGALDARTAELEAVDEARRGGTPTPPKLAPRPTEPAPNCPRGKSPTTPRTPPSGRSPPRTGWLRTAPPTKPKTHTGSSPTTTTSPTWPRPANATNAPPDTHDTDRAPTVAEDSDAANEADASDAAWAGRDSADTDAVPTAISVGAGRTVHDSKPGPTPRDIRQEAAAEPARNDGHAPDVVRVPSTGETAESVRRAQRALTELRQRQAIEKRRAADEAQERDEELARWHADDTTHASTHDAANATDTADRSALDGSDRDPAEVTAPARSVDDGPVLERTLDDH
jgi:hypothetical protein